MLHREIERESERKIFRSQWPAHARLRSGGKSFFLVSHIGGDVTPRTVSFALRKRLGQVAVEGKK